MNPIDNLPQEIEITGEIVFVFPEITIDGEVLKPELSQAIRNHSPTGFSWGYAGSGPAQLALAILMHFLPVRIALNHYQEFKSKYVASWPQGDFTIRLKLRDAIRKIAISQRIDEQC